MQSKEIIGKRVKDIITGKSGIVTAVIHWMTGCDSVCFEDVDGKSYAGEVSRFEVIDDGVSDRVDEAVLEEEETFIRSMGRRGKDRLTGFEGIAVGVCVNAFRAAQYCVQAPAKEGKLQDSIFMDCSRLSKCR